MLFSQVAVASTNFPKTLSLFYFYPSKGPTNLERHV